jgi:Major Facilitator Superfamily
MSIRPLARSAPGRVRDSVAAFGMVLALPRARLVAVTSLVARLPKGMMPLAVVLVVHQAVGSYAMAGLATGLVAAGDAASAPVKGWLADRFGRGPVLIPSAVVHVAAVGAVLVLVRDGTAGGAVAAAACLAGIGMPPVSGSIKAVWPKLAGRDALAAAYAVESLLQQLVFLSGPLVVAAVTAASNPAAALACSAVMVAGGTAAFVAAAAAAAPHSRTRRVRQERGAWQVPVVRILACATMVQSLVFGAVPVGIAAVTAAAGVPGLAGVILAALTAGGVIGTFGPSAAPGKRRYARLAACFAVALLPAAAFSTRPSAGFLIATAAALAVAGLFITPLAATSYLLTEQATTSGHRTEAFTWLSTGQAVGTAAGASLAGIAASGAGPPAALALLPAAASLFAIIARTLPPDSPAIPDDHNQPPGHPSAFQRPKSP